MKTQEQNAVEQEYGLKFLRTPQDPIMPGWVVVHNTVRRTARTRSGTRGFRAWQEPLDSRKLEKCDCGWMPELGTHYRIRSIK
jgi:hypothetical protein